MELLLKRESTEAHTGGILSRESLELLLGVLALLEMAEGTLDMPISQGTFRLREVEDDMHAWKLFAQEHLALAYDGSEVRTVNPRRVFRAYCKIIQRYV